MQTISKKLSLLSLITLINLFPVQSYAAAEFEESEHMQDYLQSRIHALNHAHIIESSITSNGYREERVLYRDLLTGDFKEFYEYTSPDGDMFYKETGECYHSKAVYSRAILDRADLRYYQAPGKWIRNEDTEGNVEFKPIEIVG